MCPQRSPRRLPHTQCGITPHSTPQLGGPVLGPLGCVGPMEAQPPPVTLSPCLHHAGQTPASLPASLPHHFCSHPDRQRVQAATARAGDQQQPPAQRTLDGRGAAGQVPPVCAGHLPGVRFTPTPHSSLSTSALMPPQLPAGNASQRARTATRCAHGLAQPVDRTQKQRADAAPFTGRDSCHLTSCWGPCCCVYEGHAALFLLESLLRGSVDTVAERRAACPHLGARSVALRSALGVGGNVLKVTPMSSKRCGAI